MKTSKNSTSESQHSPQNKGIGINFDLHYNYQELLSNFMWITVGINNEMVHNQNVQIAQYWSHILLTDRRLNNIDTIFITISDLFVSFSWLCRVKNSSPPSPPTNKKRNISANYDQTKAPTCSLTLASDRTALCNLHLYQHF